MTTRLYPLYRGRGRLALSALFRVPEDESEVPIRITLRSGEDIFVLPNDYIGRMVRFFGDLDPAISSIVRSILRRGDTAIDIGANIGVVTLQMASVVGEEGQVIAFEPVRQMHSMLTRSILANGFENVKVVNAALSAAEGVGVMRVARTNYGVGHLEATGEGEACRVIRLDDWAKREGIGAVRLLKLDVEGHESEVLEGAEAWLRMYPPQYVVFESHRSRGPFWARREVQLLRQMGYEFQEVGRTALGRLRLREISRDEAFVPFSEDFLASLRYRERQGQRA